jgi:hypothetical protein
LNASLSLRHSGQLLCKKSNRCNAAVRRSGGILIDFLFRRGKKEEGKWTRKDEADLSDEN